MKQAFTLKKEGYYKATKQMLFNSFMFILSFILIMLGVFYFTNSNFSKIFTWEPAYFTVIPICLPILIQICIDLYKLKIKYKSYKVIFDDNAILFEQLGYWQEPFFFGSNYSISKRRIRYKEITAIRKSETGYYTIKGEENSYPNTILISAQIENSQALEEILCEIKPITPHQETQDLKEYPVNETARKNQWKQYFNLKSIGMITGIYLLALLLAYLWFDPINWNLTIFLSIVSFLFIYGFTYSVLKRNNPKSPIIIDNTVIIVEKESNFPEAIPFNEITSITKNPFNLMVRGKDISFGQFNFLIIPNTIKNFDFLEQNLNTIHPIAYEKKSVSQLSLQMVNEIPA